MFKMTALGILRVNQSLVVSSSKSIFLIDVKKILSMGGGEAKADWRMKLPKLPMLRLRKAELKRLCYTTLTNTTLLRRPNDRV